MHEGLMLILYSHVKASFIQHSITKFLDSEEESKNSNGSEDEGSNTELEDDFDRDTSAKRTRKGSSRKTLGRGVKINRSKV